MKKITNIILAIEFALITLIVPVVEKVQKVAIPQVYPIVKRK